MSMGVSKPGGRKTTTPEINVTPLVDVMLVLLVIFMITIQAAKESIPLELPEAAGVAGGDDSKTTTDIHLDSEGRVHISGRTMELAEAEEEIPRMLKGQEKNVFNLNAHRKLPYEKVIKVIAAIRSAGVETILVSVDGAGPGSR